MKKFLFEKQKNMKSTIAEHNGFTFDMSAMKPDAENVLNQCVTAIKNNDKDKLMSLVIEWNSNSHRIYEFAELVPNILKAYDEFRAQENEKENEST